MRSTRIGPSGPLFQTSLVAALIGFGLYFDHAASVATSGPESVAALETELVHEDASADVRRIAQWAVVSQDHSGLPFVVVDKARARLYAFDPQGRLHGSAPVLLGAGRGDGPTAPATPAGRFVADTWLSARADGIVWVNGNTQLTLYAVPSPNAPGRGMQRLASDRVEDKRISEGSLHVAAEFYRNHLGLLRSQPSIAYVLPETLPPQQIFGAQAPDEPPLIAQSRPRAPRSPS